MSISALVKPDERSAGANFVRIVSYARMLPPHGSPRVETAGRAARRSTHEVKDLPAVTAATAYCEIDDQSAIRTYEALSRWISLRSYRLAGPKREIYLGQVLEIQFPIEPA